MWLGLFPFKGCRESHGMLGQNAWILTPNNGHLGGFHSFVFTINAEVNILVHLPTYTLVKFLAVAVVSQKEYALETLVSIAKSPSKSNTSVYWSPIALSPPRKCENARFICPLFFWVIFSF